jgi:hypothetical protein
MSLHPTPTMHVHPLRLSQIVRCPICTAATVDGVHLDSSLRHCGWAIAKGER